MLITQENRAIQPQHPTINPFTVHEQHALEDIKTKYRADGSHDALLDVEEDRLHLRKLQTEFDSAIGRKHSSEDLLKRSYNPVVDRWHVEDLRQKGDEKGLLAFKQEVWKNMETNLMERLRAVESYGKFLIKDGQLYSEFFPTEPMSKVMLRGAEYRKEHDSPEQEREGWLGELAGWQLINDTLTNPDAPIGTKMISLSPPGIAEGSAYYGRFIDVYELAEDTGEKFVKRTRIAVDFDDAGYKNLALTLNPNFFEGYDGRPEDAWYLSRPQEGNVPFFKKEGGLTPEDFQKIFGQCKDFIRYYIDTLYEETINWENLAVAFNAILNKADATKDMFVHGLMLPETRRASEWQNENTDMLGMLAMEVQRLGRQRVKTVGGYGCPDNKGIEFGKNGLLDLPSLGIDLSNSVAQFGTLNLGEKQEWFHCPKCGWKANGPIGDGPCGGCGLTKDAWAEESGVDCA